MKRIGLTQRVDLVHEYNERRDSLDQRWSDLGPIAKEIFKMYARRMGTTKFHFLFDRSTQFPRRENGFRV